MTPSTRNCGRKQSRTRYTRCRLMPSSTTRVYKVVRPIEYSANAMAEELAGTIRSSVEGSRWAMVPRFLRDRCFTLGIDLEMDIDKGLIRENVRFTIKGPESKLRRLMRELKEGIDEYNQD